MQGRAILGDAEQSAVNILAIEGKAEQSAVEEQVEEHLAVDSRWVSAALKQEAGEEDEILLEGTELSWKKRNALLPTSTLQRDIRKTQLRRDGTLLERSAADDASADDASGDDASDESSRSSSSSRGHLPGDASPGGRANPFNGVDSPTLLSYLGLDSWLPSALLQLEIPFFGKKKKMSQHVGDSGPAVSTDMSHNYRVTSDAKGIGRSTQKSMEHEQAEHRSNNVGGGLELMSKLSTFWKALRSGKLDYLLTPLALGLEVLGTGIALEETCLWKLLYVLYIEEGEDDVRYVPKNCLEPLDNLVENSRQLGRQYFFDF